MLAAYVLAIAIPYAVFEPTARYIYLIYGVLAFLAAEAVGALIGAFSSENRFVLAAPPRMAGQS